jgi:hypothetical protein
MHRGSLLLHAANAPTAACTWLRACARHRRRRPVVTPQCVSGTSQAAGIKGGPGATLGTLSQVQYNINNSTRPLLEYLCVVRRFSEHDLLPSSGAKPPVLAVRRAA